MRSVLYDLGKFKHAYQTIKFLTASEFENYLSRKRIENVGMSCNEFMCVWYKNKLRMYSCFVKFILGSNL